MARSKGVKAMRSCVQISGRGASGQKQLPQGLEHTEEGHRERGLDKGQDSGFYTEPEGKTLVPLRRAVPQSDAFPKDHLAASRSRGGSQNSAQKANAGTQVGGKGSWPQNRSTGSSTKWSDSQSVVKIEQYLLKDWMWVWAEEASRMARGASSTNVRDEDMEGQGQETTRSFPQLVHSKANREPGR